MQFGERFFAVSAKLMSRILTISLCAKNSRENSLLHTRCRCAESSVLCTSAVQCGCVVHCAGVVAGVQSTVQLYTALQRGV